jgi:hypothetical protein
MVTIVNLIIVSVVKMKGELIAINERNKGSMQIEQIKGVKVVVLTVRETMDLNQKTFDYTGCANGLVIVTPYPSLHSRAAFCLKKIERVLDEAVKHLKVQSTTISKKLPVGITTYMAYGFASKDSELTAEDAVQLVTQKGMQPA